MPSRKVPCQGALLAAACLIVGAGLAQASSGRAPAGPGPDPRPPSAASSDSASPSSSVAPPSESSSGTTIDDARAAVAKWVATQQVIHEERARWAQERDLLTSRIGLVEDEVAALEAELAESRKAADEQRSRSAELSTDQALLRELASLLEAHVTASEAEVRRLVPLLPAHLQEKTAPLQQRIPEGADTNVSLAERYQNVLGILGEVSKANGEIFLATEIRPLSDGRPSEVKTVYAGLAQAWYLSPSGEAGVGVPGPDGWTWTPRPGLERDVARVIQVLQDKAAPAFVPLPVTLR